MVFIWTFKIYKNVYSHIGYFKKRVSFYLKNKSDSNIKIKGIVLNMKSMKSY